jgi:hypothetical protein
MAIPFLNHLDLRSVSQIKNMILHHTTSASASNVEGKIIYDTGTDTIKFYNGSAWISLTGLDANTWRPVTAGGNTLSTSETLAFTAGTDVTITESAGAVTINSTDVQLTEEQVEDFVGGMVTGNTETFIDVSYQDSDGTLDFVVPVKDEDNMTSASATHLATQQSIKAYVDDTTQTVEEVQDIVGAMFSGNTETRVAATYVDGGVGAGKINVVVDDLNTDVNVNVTNLSARLAQISANVTIGDASDVTVIIPGDLQVTGTTTTNNVETVSTTNGVVFEGHAADDFEGTLKGGTYTADRTYTLPDSPGVVNIGYSTTVGGATSIEVTHSLNSRAVIVQLFDTSSFETVYADVVRTTVNTVDLTFAVAPSAGDITVLVTRVA